MTEDVMVDLETMGTAPRSAIISIGAASFGTMGVKNTFHTVVSLASCAEHGLLVDPQTRVWWDSQELSAKKLLAETESPLAPSLPAALQHFDEWFRDQGYGARIWGNGSDFDVGLLEDAFAAISKEIVRQPPWKYNNVRCYRTLKSLRPDIEAGDFQGVPHDALDDAAHQARHAAKLLTALEPGWARRTS